jgi:hypothetical protein
MLLTEEKIMNKKELRDTLKKQGYAPEEIKKFEELVKKGKKLPNKPYTVLDAVGFQLSPTGITLGKASQEIRIG